MRIKGKKWVKDPVKGQMWVEMRAFPPPSPDFFAATAQKSGEGLRKYVFSTHIGDLTASDLVFDLASELAFLPLIRIISDNH